MIRHDVSFVMLRTPKLTVRPSLLQTVNAYRSDTGAVYGTPDHRITGGFYTHQEYLDDISDQTPYIGVKPCNHWLITRKLLADTVPPFAYSWATGDHSATWNQRPPDSMPTDYLWNSWALDNSFASDGQNQPVGTYGNCVDPVKGLPVLAYIAAGGALVMVPPSNLDALVNRAINALGPGIRPANNVSLVNSIIELKDFHSLPTTLRRIRDVGLPLVRRLLKGTDPKKKIVSLRKLLRTSSDGYLQSQFNVLPLLSDIAAVRRALSDARDQLKKLIRDADKPLVRHFKVSLADQYVNNWSTRRDVINHSTYTWLVPNALLSSRTVNYLVREFNAMLQFSYKLPAGITEGNLMDALLDRMGVNLNPRIIWNAIPWSFVVDWLVGVNQWLDNFRTRNIEPITNITAFCYSWRAKRLITTTCGFDSNNPCVEYVEDAYQRIANYPSLYSSLVTSGLSPTEFSLAGALALTR